MNDESEHQEWILCPKCGNKTRLRLRKDTVLTNFPLFCPKCKEESLIDAEKFIVKEARRSRRSADCNITVLHCVVCIMEVK